MATKKLSTCILCSEAVGSSQADETCWFHPGVASFVFSTGADTRSGPDMGYRDIYAWSCCGKREPSTLVDGRELPPLRRANCASRSSHKTEARVQVVFADQWEAFCRASQIDLASLGIDTQFTNLSSYETASGADHDCVAFILGDARHDQAMTLTEDLRRSIPDQPMLIFSDPDRVDGWRLQASSSDGLTSAQLAAAILDTVRSRYVPEDGWSPRVFFSYTRADNHLMNEWVDELSKMERACWVDKHILSPGIDWSSEIEKGIVRSDLFVMLLTRDTPRTTYCWKELAIAREHGKPVFVIAYDGTAQLFKGQPAESEREWGEFAISYGKTGSKSDRKVLTASTPLDTVVYDVSRSDGHSDYRSHLEQIWWMRHFLQEWPQTWDVDDAAGRAHPIHNEDTARTHRRGASNGTFARFIASVKGHLGITSAPD